MAKRLAAGRRVACVRCFVSLADARREHGAAPQFTGAQGAALRRFQNLSLIHISEPTRLALI
eukprot:11173308-Alexandrium_andersonii.AAC.1